MEVEVAELFELGEQVDRGELELPEGFVFQDEVMLRQERLLRLGEAKSILEQRAQKSGVR